MLVKCCCNFWVIALAVSSSRVNANTDGPEPEIPKLTAPIFHGHFAHFVKIGDQHRAYRLNQYIFHAAAYQVNILHKQTAYQTGYITPLGNSIFHFYFLRMICLASRVGTSTSGKTMAHHKPAGCGRRTTSMGRNCGSAQNHQIKQAQRYRHGHGRKPFLRLSWQRVTG
jgi:hypothetical protein